MNAIFNYFFGPQDGGNQESSGLSAENCPERNEELISFFYTSERKFISEYRRCFVGTPKVKGLFFHILGRIKDAVVSMNQAVLFERLCNLIHCLNDTDPTIEEYLNNVENPLLDTNLVILACKYNRLETLKCLLHRQCRVLIILSAVDAVSFPLPEQVDGENHNAFYYAIRSSNISLLDVIIDQWPGSFFALHPEKLHEIISKAYREIKLKNIPLSEEMEVFTESKLTDLYFWLDGCKQNHRAGNDLQCTIQDRIELVLQNIALLTSRSSNLEDANTFLFVSKFIAQNIFILKRQLKFSYDRLPWEEIEFCLVCFVVSQLKRLKMNLFYRSTLSKSRISVHLENFGKRLKDEKYRLKHLSEQKLSELPNLSREEVVKNIRKNCPEFEGLYNDFQILRDVHSLEKISISLNSAMLADPNEREGKLTIIRVLQVIGEHLKNTLESPKLSNVTCERLLLSLPQNTRKIIIDLRNTLSHSYSLSKRIEIEERADTKFYIGIQNDIKKIESVITSILFNNVIETVKTLVMKIANIQNFSEVQALAKLFHDVEIFLFLNNYKPTEHSELKKLIKQLGNIITDQTEYEKTLFKEICGLINMEDTKNQCTKEDYTTGLALITSQFMQMGDEEIDENYIRYLKFTAKRTLEMFSPKTKLYHARKLLNGSPVSNISQLSRNIITSACSRMKSEQIYELYMIQREIIEVTAFASNNIKWIEKFSEGLSGKASSVLTTSQLQTCNTAGKKGNKKLLTLKLSELQRIIEDNDCGGKTHEKLLSYRRNKKLQPAIEMLVLDVMSILSVRKECLQNNLFLLDENVPLLIGKSLRDHLAHENSLTELLMHDPTVAVILNARKLVSVKNIDKKNIGKSVKDNPSALRAKHHQDLLIITLQEELFIALAEGDFQRFKNCLKEGADIRARNLDLWTTLHFASMASNLDILTFLLYENMDFNVKNADGQTPLHVAAKYGRQDIAEFLIKRAGLRIHDVDNLKRTPLHVAARNGHQGTVQVLLRNKSSTSAKDLQGFSPIHLAVRHNHFGAFQVLMEQEAHADSNQVNGGYTSLHVAAESGHLELVNFLLFHEANANTVNDMGGTPLHTSALHGHLDVVKALIRYGAKVNVTNIDGCTPLHYAVESGHERVARVLLSYGADANSFDKAYNSPSHYAAKFGHEGIMIALLGEGADVSKGTFQGLTPLHFAAWHGHSKIVSLLLRHRCNINAKCFMKKTPLFYAIQYGQKEVSKLFIEHGAEINVKDVEGLTPLHHAATQEGCEDLIELLIKNNGDVNAADINGTKPIHKAASVGRTNAISLLRKYKADVNSRNNLHMTPLQLAASLGFRDSVIFLVKHGADVNAKDDHGATPLHSAIMSGDSTITAFLVKNKADVNVKGKGSPTPLQLAVETGETEIVQILLENGANLNLKSGDITPLQSAIEVGHKDIVELLINNGANVNEGKGEPLSLAIRFGLVEVLELLLKKGALLNRRYGPEKLTPLHLAARSGNEKIALALIKNGAQVDALTVRNATPLFIAAFQGCEEVVDVLISSNADVNAKNSAGVPLHMAVGLGHCKIVEMLLNNGARVNVRDEDNKSPLEIAVLKGYLNITKLLLQKEKVNLNSQGNDDFTLLHIASQRDNLEMVKYLVGEGCNIDAPNYAGSKPIHIAAREGQVDIVDFFLSKGQSIDEPGGFNQTLLHYAAGSNRVECAKFLITRGADLNRRDFNGVTPLHIAFRFNHKEVCELLLKQGAFYEAGYRCIKDPLSFTEDSATESLLKSTKQLFKAVKSNDVGKVKSLIQAGASLDAKNSEFYAPLHYAAWKGYTEVTTLLLQNKANPNVINDKNKSTPLHYAVKFAHWEIVLTLLHHDAVYEIVSDAGKTPLDFATDPRINKLLRLVDECFKNVRSGNLEVISHVQEINDEEIIKAVARARNKENQTIVVVAMHCNPSMVEQLNRVFQGEIVVEVNKSSLRCEQDVLVQSQRIYKKSLNRRQKILGADSPGTLDVHMKIAFSIYKQGKYEETLSIVEPILKKRLETLGENHRDTLSAHSFIGLVVHRQEENEKAYKILTEVYHKQKQILGADDEDTLDTQFHLGLVLERLQRYEEALNIYMTLFERRKNLTGNDSRSTISAQNNIAMVLASQGKHEEALKIYREVLQKKIKVLGMDHTDTLRTSNSIAAILYRQRNYEDAAAAFQALLKIQTKCLGPNHPETVMTKYNLASVNFDQGKFVGALKIFTEVHNQVKKLFGPRHPKTLDVSQRIMMIDQILKLRDSSALEVLGHPLGDMMFEESSSGGFYM